MRLVGFDPSMRHWGIAAGVASPEGVFDLQLIQTIEPVPHTGKQVRQNSEDMDTAEQLYTAAKLAAKHAHAVFVEAPVGSQSASAMKSYGICIGLLAALRAEGIPSFLVTATEVKLAGYGTKTATKKQMISWAMAQYPNAAWPTHKGKGAVLVSEGKAEHMADAVGAIHAGCKLPAFRQLLALARHAA